MLLGCCHCESDTSSSSDIPPSSSDPSVSSSAFSSGSSSIGVVIIPSCSQCIDDYYPSVLKLVIPSFGTPPGGSCSSYNGTFYCYHDGGTSTSYFSVEKVIDINTGLNTTMTSGPNPATRFTVSYRCSRGLPLGTQQDVELNIRWSTTPSSSAIGLASVKYRYTNPSTASAIDCLQAITLTKVVAAVGSGPCGTTSNSDWPATVSITPE